MMLDAHVISDLSRALRESRIRSIYGAKVDADNVFSKSEEIMAVAERAVAGGVSVAIAESHTWSIVEPASPLQDRCTDIAHYHFDEATGTTVDDTSQNGNDLTLTGCTWGTGKWGACLTLNGTSDYASVTALSAEPLRNYLYVSAWVNPSSVTGTRPICKLTNRVLLYLDAGMLKCQIIDGVTTYTVSSGRNLTAGTWQFVTLQFLDGQVFLGVGDLVYKTTIACTTYASEFPAEGLALTVGYDGTNFFAGDIDELVVDASVRVMDDVPPVSRIMGSNDVIMWPFKENSGTSVASPRLLGDTLTLSGGTWVAGQTRYAVQFDGFDDYGYCIPVAETFTGRTLSVEVGVKFAANDVTVPILTQAGGLNLSYDGAGGIVAALGGVTNPSTVIGQLTPTVGAWYNLCIVYGDGYKELWVNGQKFGEIACTGTAVMPAVPLYLAKSGTTYGAITVDRVRVYRARLKPYYRGCRYFMPGENGFTSLDDWIIYPA